MNVLKMTRLLKAISQAQLARAVNVTPPMISRIENDLLRNTPSVISLKKRIAEALGIQAEIIFPDLKTGSESLEVPGYEGGSR